MYSRLHRKRTIRIWRTTRIKFARKTRVLIVRIYLSSVLLVTVSCNLWLGLGHIEVEKCPRCEALTSLGSTRRPNKLVCQSDSSTSPLCVEGLHAYWTSAQNTRTFGNISRLAALNESAVPRNWTHFSASLPFGSAKAVANLAYFGSSAQRVTNCLKHGSCLNRQLRIACC